MGTKPEARFRFIQERAEFAAGPGYLIDLHRRRCRTVAASMRLDLGRVSAILAGHGDRRETCMRFALLRLCRRPRPLRDAARADPLLDGIGKVPGAIEDVRIGGTWEKGGRAASTGGDHAERRRRRRRGCSSSGSPIATTARPASTTRSRSRSSTALKVDIVDYTAESDQDGLSVYLETINPTATPSRITSCTSPRRRTTGSDRRATRPMLSRQHCGAPSYSSRIAAIRRGRSAARTRCLT